MKRVQYKGGIAYHVSSINGRQQWRRMGHKDDPETWEMYRLLEAAVRDKEGSRFAAVASRLLDEICRPDPVKVRSEKTLREYRRQLREDGNILMAFGHMAVEKIKPSHLYGYIRAHTAKVAPNRDMSVISLVLQQAVEEGLIDRNPAREVKRLPKRVRDRYVTDAEYVAIKESAPLSVQIAMDLAYLLGPRLSTILNFRHQDIRDGFLHGWEGKKRKKVRYPMTPQLEAVIRRSQVDIGHIVCRLDGKGYTLGGFESIWRRAKLSVGLGDIHFHDLRAKHATDRDELGMNAALALGNTDSVTREVYTRHALGRIVEPLAKLPGVNDGTTD